MTFRFPASSGFFNNVESVRNHWDGLMRNIAVVVNGIDVASVRDGLYIVHEAIEVVVQAQQ